MLSMFRRQLGSAATPDPQEGDKKEVKRGLVLGELLVAFLLLAVAISSLTALMYTVTRDPRSRNQAEVACTGTGSATSPKCAAESRSSGSKLLTSGCASRRGSKVEACNDSFLTAQAAEGTIIRSRTDSAALAMLPRKPVKRAKRPDLGFVR